MPTVAPWQLRFSFLCCAAIVLVMGYRYLSTYPVGAAIGVAIALGVLGYWYARARRATGEATGRTLRKLSLFVVVLVFIVPYLLRLLPKP